MRSKTRKITHTVEEIMLRRGKHAVLHVRDVMIKNGYSDCREDYEIVKWIICEAEFSSLKNVIKNVLTEYLDSFIAALAMLLGAITGAIIGYGFGSTGFSTEDFIIICIFSLTLYIVIFSAVSPIKTRLSQDNIRIIRNMTYEQYIYIRDNYGLGSIKGADKRCKCSGDHSTHDHIQSYNKRDYDSKA